MTLKVLYQDQNYIAVFKPSGLLVHRTELDSRHTEAVVQILRDQINQKVYPVHRLDRPTSGILVMALNPEAAGLLAKEFSDRQVKKKYIALVRGHFKNEILLDHPLRYELEENATPEKQEAITLFKPLSSIEINESVDRYSTSRYSLVQAFPKTGRAHQIRRHLKHLNHPIIGDVNHGNGKHNKFFSEKFNLKSLLLTHNEISFHHPILKKETIIQSEIPESFKDIIQKLGLIYDPTT